MQQRSDVNYARRYGSKNEVKEVIVLEASFLLLPMEGDPLST